MISQGFFDSSSVLAGIMSFVGASHRLLFASHIKEIRGFISEEVLTEVSSKLHKTELSPSEFDLFLAWTNLFILPKPKSSTKALFSSFVSDPNDLHIFASASQIKDSILVSLDKKHIISLKSKITHPHIMSPSDLLQHLLVHS